MLKTFTGFLYGTSYEIVYQGSTGKDYLSELTWEIKPLFYAGAEIDYSFKDNTEHHGFSLCAGLKAAIPMKTGVMEDRDWNWGKYGVPPGTLTNFSSHDNHTKAAFLVNFGASFSIPAGKFIFGFFLNADYMFFKWEAWNGYLQYMDDNFIIHQLSGLQISYIQNWFLFNTGATADLFLGRFTISGGVFFPGPFVLYSHR